MKITKNELKKRFHTGMYPTQVDFENLIDTLAGVDDMIDITKIENLEKALQEKADGDALELHILNLENPHTVTAEQVGLGFADNTADIEKPISNATQEALDLKVDQTALEECLNAILEVINQETLQKVSERGNATNVNLFIPDAVDDSHAATLRQVRQGLQEALQALADRVGNAEDNVTMEFLNAEIAKLNLLVTSDDLNLDTIQEIVVFIKANSDVIDAISTNKLDKTTFEDWKSNTYAPFIGGVYSKVEVDGLLEGKMAHTILASVATTGNYNDLINLPEAIGQYMYFAHESKGSGEGSSWANAKAFSIEAYNSMPVDTAALLLGDSTKKYTLSNTLNIVARKPVFGGFIGNGLLRDDCAILKEDEVWENVLFSAYASVLEGGNFMGISMNNGYISNVCIGNYTTSDSGGGVYASNSVILNCSISNCSADGKAGGAYIEHSMISHCNISHCSSSYGGGVFANRGVISNCNISSCRSTDGGGIFADGGTISNCNISSCCATDGGGIFADGGTVSNCNISSCRATEGGGIFANRGAISNSSLSNCHVDSFGGGIYSNSSTISNCAIFNSVSYKEGGGIYVDASSIISNCIISNCYAPSFPGVYPDYRGITHYWNNTTSKEDINPIAPSLNTVKVSSAGTTQYPINGTALSDINSVYYWCIKNTSTNAFRTVILPTLGGASQAPVISEVSSIDIEAGKIIEISAMYYSNINSWIFTTSKQF